MIPETITIILPLPAKVLSPNFPVASRGMMFAKAAATGKYRRLTREAIEAERIETAPWEKVIIEALFYFAHSRRRDPDNAMSSLKSAYDGIVDAGLVKDDDSKHMERKEPIFQVNRKHPRVVLKITRCK